ncbi:hypothetical protein KPH14_012732 [Odynerus spinipes]|uniref:Uncharacterized protein n=1 Tax=Odynerus spinipes TaxID=1348599 RepID=A0AAD9RDR6_9HYME|nr:hypothetical protein KPH14_012732 [Odynerus spinipes]
MAEEESGWEPRHYREVTSVLPDFDPVKGNLTINQWIEKIEEYGDMYQWDEITVRHYALSKMVGVARKWRDSLPCLNRSWLQWKELLRENFPESKSNLKIMTTRDEDLLTPPATPTRSTLRATTHQVIPDHYLGHVTVAADASNRELYVEGGLRSEGPTLPRCIVNTDEEGKTVLPVLNVTGQRLVINPGDVVTRADDCEEGSTGRDVNTEPITEDQVDTDLDGEEKQRLLKALDDNRDLVAYSIRQLGRTNPTDWRTMSGSS